MEISKKGVANGDPFELIKLSYSLNKEKFKDAFGKVKVKIESDKDLENLSKLYISKLDISGKIKSDDGVIMFDTMRIIDSMKGYTTEEIKSIQPLLVD